MEGAVVKELMQTQQTPRQRINHTQTKTNCKGRVAVKKLNKLGYERTFKEGFAAKKMI